MKVRTQLFPKPAFTLIELMFSVSIIVVMTAIAIPSFSTLNGANSWNDGVGQISSCITTAQRAAASSVPNTSSAAVRFTAAKLVYTASTSSLTCTDLTYTDQAGKPLELSSLENNASSGTNFASQANLGGLAGATCSPTGATCGTYYLYFSVATNGQLVGYNSGTNTGGNITVVDQTSGFQLALTNASNQTTTTLSLPAIGAPLLMNTQ